MASSRKTIRLEMSLSPSPGGDPDIINYRDLIEKKIEQTTHQEGDSPNEDKQLCLPTAQQLRRKYRTWDFSDFRSLGCGYQDDSFIDNEETCDESVLSTAHITFHIHSKSDSPTDSEYMELETSNETLKSASECESDKSFQSIKKSDAAKSSKDVSPHHIPMASVFFEETKRTRKVVCEVSPRSKPSVSQLHPMVVVSNGTSKFSKKTDHFIINEFLSSITKAPRGGRLPVKAQSSKPGKPRKQGASSSGLPNYKVSNVSCKVRAPSKTGARSLSSLSRVSAILYEDRSTQPLPCSSSNDQHLSKEDAAIQPVLPDSILTLLEIVTATDPVDKKRILPEANGEVLLKLSEECRILPQSTRMFVYEQIAQHWDCAVKTVSKRFGRIRAHMDEQPVRECLMKLRCRLRAELKNAAGEGGAIREFTALDSDLLRATLLAKARWLEKHPPRKGSVRDALQRFVDEEILPMSAAYDSLAHASAVFVVREEVRRLVSSASGTSAVTSTPHRKGFAPSELKTRKHKKQE